MDWISLFGVLGVGALGGALLTQVMIGHREKAARAVAFRKQQLEQFYGPLLAMHKEIRARSELRVKLQKAIDTEAASDPHIGAIAKNIQDENATFRDVLMPRYREMVNVFREKMWLAEPETRDFFPKLVEFFDVWDKILADKLPGSIALAIGHTEENLKPLYRHLEEVHDRLRSEVRSGGMFGLFKSKEHASAC